MLLTYLPLLIASTLLQGGIEPEPADMPPNHHLWSARTSRMGISLPGDDTVMVLARLRTDTKSVTLDWRVIPDAPSPTPKGSDQQAFSLTYWPTAMIPLGNNHLVVAGKMVDGDTIIEEWVFDNPTVNYSIPSIRAGKRLGKTTLIHSSLPGKGLVAHLVGLQGQPRSVLIQFWASKGLWTLNCDTLVLEEKASREANPPAGVLSVPELDNVFSSLMSRNHVQHGYVYTLVPPTSQAEQRPVVVLLDEDRNGSLDSYLLLDDTAWEQQGFSDAANYIP